jgi:hypothetical protein
MTGAPRHPPNLPPRTWLLADAKLSQTALIIQASKNKIKQMRAIYTYDVYESPLENLHYGIFYVDSSSNPLPEGIIMGNKVDLPQLTGAQCTVLEGIHHYRPFYTSPSQTMPRHQTLNHDSHPPSDDFVDLVPCGEAMDSNVNNHGESTKSETSLVYVVGMFLHCVSMNLQYSDQAMKLLDKVISAQAQYSSFAKRYQWIYLVQVRL